MATERDYIYLSGCVDCDGSISFNRKDVREASPRTAIGSTVLFFVAWLKETFGGNYCPNGGKGKFSKKLFWVWQVNGKEATDILERCLPYLVIKKEEAKLAIKWQKEKLAKILIFSKGQRRWKLPNKEIERRKELKRKLEELNRNRGEFIG